MDVDALFAQADAARREMQRESGDVGMEDDELDAACIFVNAPNQVRTGHATYTVGSDGDIHACQGLQCRHVRLNLDNHYVCGISGRVVGTKTECESYPGSTGRSTKSANPDDTAGMPVGGWVKRRDMYAASVAAYKMAPQMSDAEVVPVPAAPPATAPTIKRGALCVDETPDANAAPKKTRNSRKENWTRDAIDKLAAEALTVIDKLFIAHRKPQEPEPPPDPRLQNLEFVKRMAIRKYVKRCADGESELNLDVLSNVIVHANEFVREQRAEAARRLDEATRRATGKRSRTEASASGQIRDQLSQLIVSLWRASCMTKHFMTSKKGSDSFRPFAAGILYSLKRGLYLPDGTCVVPVLNELAACLPALRSASSTPAAKQLQSSSHRGICSIQRALTSLLQMPAEEAQPALRLLRDASRQGAFLRELVSRNS
jgi:hypothetical protein